MTDIPLNYTELFEALKAEELNVSFRKWAMGDPVLVTGQLFENGEIKGYKRDVYIIRNSDGNWNTSVGGIDLEDGYLLEEVVRFTAQLMKTNDEEFDAEFKRRVGIIEDKKKV